MAFSFSTGCVRAHALIIARLAGRYFWLELTFSAAVTAAISIYLSAFGRGIWIVPSQFILVAQQWVLGRELYVDLGYVDPPPLFIYYASVVLFAMKTGLSLVLSYNLLTTVLVVVCGMLFGLATPRHRIAAGCLWIATVVLMANDGNVDREYFFMMAWVPYLMMRTGLGAPPRSAMIIAGILAGYMICMKPHFGFIFVATEIFLMIFLRLHLRGLPLVALIASGLAQVALFLLIFDVRAHFYDLSLWRYYTAIGYNPWEALKAIARSPFFQMSFAASLLSVVLLRRTTTTRPFALATAASLVSSAVMLVAHGQFRYYYVLLFLYPAAGITITILLQGPQHFVGHSKYLRVILFGVAIALSGAFFQRATAADQGILTSAYERYIKKNPTFAFGFMKGDPFIAYVERSIPKDAGLYILNTGYGSPHQDPVVSMVRMGRPWPSKYPAGDYDFWFGLGMNDTKQTADAVERLRHDLDTGADWFIARSDDSQNRTVDYVLRGYPGFRTWFEQNFKEVDKFDRYVVFRRITPRLGANR